MNVNELSKFKIGDIVRFLGSEKSRYGHNEASNEFIGSLVTIKAVHSGRFPDAYTFEEFEKKFRHKYWFSENCFEEETLVELPEFEASGSIDELFA